jgi:hypothetical protein
LSAELDCLQGKNEQKFGQSVATSSDDDWSPNPFQMACARGVPGVSRHTQMPKNNCPFVLI